MSLIAEASCWRWHYARLPAPSWQGCHFNSNGRSLVAPPRSDAISGTGRGIAGGDVILPSILVVGRSEGGRRVVGVMEHVGTKPCREHVASAQKHKGSFTDFACPIVAKAFYCNWNLPTGLPT